MDKPWKVVVVLVALFLAGGVTGGFLTLRLARIVAPNRRPPGMQAQQPRRPVEQWGQQFRKQFAERLSLSAEQQKKIDAVRQATEEELRRLRHQSLVQTNEVTERLNKQISELLTPEQRPKFEKMMKERRERAQRMIQEQQQRMQRGEPPGPGGARPPRPPPKGASPAGPPGEPAKAGTQPGPAEPPKPAGSGD